MSEYTPTTEDIRDALAMSCEGIKSQAEFDRWLAQRDQKAEARGAARERERVVAEIEAGMQEPPTNEGTFAFGWMNGAEWAKHVARGESGGVL